MPQCNRELICFEQVLHQPLIVYGTSFCVPLLKMFVFITMQLSVPAPVKMEELAQLRTLAPVLPDGLECTVIQVCTQHSAHGRGPSAENGVLDSQI